MSSSAFVILARECERLWVALLFETATDDARTVRKMKRNENHRAAERNNDNNNNIKSRERQHNKQNTTTTAAP
eukprot:scaffold9324_cov144-Amphora_coffeaeformis.AAC.3